MNRRLVKNIFCVVLAFVQIIFLFGCTANQINYTSRLGKIVFFETDDDADCTLISLGDKNILIDTGEKDDAKSIINYLENNSITTLDYIIISHFDKDHCGGATKIINTLDVNEVIHGEYIKESSESKKMFKAMESNGVNETIINEKQELTFGDITLNFYPAESESYNEKQSNNSSLMVKAKINDTTILFTGDIEGERVSEILNSNDNLSADILKMPCHGREITNEAELLKMINPTYTIITSESDEKDVNENVDNLASYLGEYYYSCDDNIVFSITQNGIELAL